MIRTIADPETRRLARQQYAAKIEERERQRAEYKRRWYAAHRK
jgi:hypothetical protein